MVLVHAALAAMMGATAVAAAGAETARPAAILSGSIGPDDYPASALRQGAQGTTIVRFRVRTNGRVGDCRVIRSSGTPALDQTTCSLVQRRFRFSPAIGRSGTPVEEVRTHRAVWSLPREAPASPGKLPASD